MSRSLSYFAFGLQNYFKCFRFIHPLLTNQFIVLNLINSLLNVGTEMLVEGKKKLIRSMAEKLIFWEWFTMCIIVISFFSLCWFILQFNLMETVTRYSRCTFWRSTNWFVCCPSFDNQTLNKLLSASKIQFIMKLFKINLLSKTAKYTLDSM